MTNADDPDVLALLPLPPAFFHILIALGDEERHGYAVMQDVSDRTDGRVRMSPGNVVRIDSSNAGRGPDRRAVPRQS